MTNKPRKRAPGAGRKPKGPISGNAGWLQARITADLHDRLKREAAQNGRSVSQEAQVRLKESFDLPAKLLEKWGPPDVWAIAQLVARTVRSVHTSVGANPFTEAGDLAWYRNPFTYAAVVDALSIVLLHYKPEGSQQVPEAVEKQAALLEEAGQKEASHWRSPEGIGSACALGVLERVASALTPPPLAGAEAHYASAYYVFPHIHKILEGARK